MGYDNVSQPILRGFRGVGCDKLGIDADRGIVVQCALQVKEGGTSYDFKHELFTIYGYQGLHFMCKFRPW